MNLPAGINIVPMSAEILSVSVQNVPAGKHIEQTRIEIVSVSVLNVLTGHTNRTNGYKVGISGYTECTYRCTVLQIIIIIIIYDYSLPPTRRGSHVKSDYHPTHSQSQSSNP